MSVADEVFDLTLRALAKCSEQQRRVYQLVHGITDEGQTEPMRLDAAAHELGLSRSATRWHLAMSETAVYRYIAEHYVKRRLQETLTELPGTPTVETYTSVGMSIRDRAKQAYTNITLGPGSEQVMRAGRLGSADARAATYLRIQQTMTRGGSN